MYYDIFYRELIICGDFGAGVVYFRGMERYLLSVGFFLPCCLFLPVCARVLCLWFQSLHSYLTFTYIHVYWFFSKYASSNFWFINFIFCFLILLTITYACLCRFLHIFVSLFSTYMYICPFIIYFHYHFDIKFFLYFVFLFWGQFLSLLVNYFP